MAADQLSQKLQQDILHELTTVNKVLELISLELQEIKQLTNPGGEFEINILNNATIIKTLANMKQIDIDKLPQLTRLRVDENLQSNENNPYEEHDTTINSSMDAS